MLLSCALLNRDTHRIAFFAMLLCRCLMLCYCCGRCISRQLWWGHRIPAYFATVDGEKPVDQVECPRLSLHLFYLSSCSSACIFFSFSVSPTYFSISLGWVRLGWVLLGWAGLGWVGLVCVGVEWGGVELGWVGSGWVGLVAIHALT